MNEQLTQVPVGIAAENLKPSIDPLRRVYVPIEKKTPNGTWVFRTLDRTMYARADDGSIHRVDKKVNGKEARKLRAKARKR